MLFNEEKNIDYISMFLGRVATDDEINVLNDLWHEVLPFRYLKGFYPKLNKKFFFTNKNLKKIKLRNHHLLVNSSTLTYQNSEAKIKGDILKSVAQQGRLPDGIELLTGIRDKNILNIIANYCEHSCTPIINAKYVQNNFNGADIFSLNLIKNSKIQNPKIKNGLNLIVIGEQTNVENPHHFNKITQKKLCAISYELVKNKFALGCQTCEEGIFSAIVKLLQKSNFGAFISIDNLHKTDNNAQTWQYLTSKDPERLLFAIPNMKLMKLIELVDKYQIPFSIIGKVDNSKVFRVTHKGRLVINIPKKLIFSPVSKINNFDYKLMQPSAFKEFTPPIQEKFYDVINSDEFLSKKNLFSEFNPYIGNKTTLGLSENSVAELFFPKAKLYISSTIHSNELQIDYNPYVAGENLVCEGIRKISALGHDPVCISVICKINFQKKGEIKKFDEVRKGICFAAKKLKTEILNVHIVPLSASDEELDQNSTFTINVIGKRGKHSKRFLPYFEKTKNTQNIYVIGKPDNLNCTSTYQKYVCNEIFPYPDEVNTKFEKRLLKGLKYLQKNELISACISVDKFGIMGALTKALCVNQAGFKSTFNGITLEYLFNENPSRFLISSENDLSLILKTHKIPFVVLGEITDKNSIILNDFNLNCDDFYQKYFGQN